MLNSQEKVGRTELADEAGEHKGTTATNRPRQIGWDSSEILEEATRYSDSNPQRTELGGVAFVFVRNSGILASKRGTVDTGPQRE